MAWIDSRFDRQVRFAPLGADGQARLEAARVLIVGCGALGGSLALQLVRSGVGQIVLADRDVVELSNLPRQVLFYDTDVGTPKAQAASQTLQRIGGPSRIEAHDVHVDADVLIDLAQGAHLILDGTDNLASRYLINDYCVSRQVPWIYGGVVGSSGLVLAVIPGAGACLRCLFPAPPEAGSLETCQTSGVILPAVQLVASLQAGACLRLLARSGQDRELEPPSLIMVDAWSGELRCVGASRDPACPCCGQRTFPFLDAPTENAAVALCGRNTVQVRPGHKSRTDLVRLAQRVQQFSRSQRAHPGVLEFEVEEFRLRVFPDGRALIEGTEDPARARAVYDRYVGS